MSTIKLIDTAYEIFRYLGEPDDLSIPIIMFWLRASNNLGELNSILAKNYSINSSDLEINPVEEYTEKESSIYSKLFELWYVQKKIKENLGAASISSVVEVVDTMGGKIRMTSKNDIAKTYLQLRKDLRKELKELLTDYGISTLTVLQVAGTDYIPGYYTPHYPNYWRDDASLNT